jgi:hypothetical protein
MLKFIMKLLGWSYHPAIVVHHPDECPACRVIIQRMRYQRLVNTLAREMLRYTAREELLMKRVLCMRAPLDAEDADDRRRELDANRH